MNVLLLILLALGSLTLASVLLAAESALSFVPRSEAEQLGQGRNGRHIQKILDAPRDYMHGVRFLRIFAETCTAIAVAMVAVSLIDHVWLAGFLATVVMAGVSFVLVGVSPRQYGRSHPAAVVVATAPLVHWLCALLGPIPRWLAEAGLRLAGQQTPVDDAFFTEEEFREFVDRATEADYIEDEEAELIHSVFDLGDTLVAAVMVPRTDMIWIHREDSIHQAMKLFIRSGFSRIPVIGESADDIEGMLYFKDVAALVLRLDSQEAGAPCRESMRPVQYVPDSMSASDLLRQMQREQQHVAIVIDEYGGTAGLVTLEDVLEEIVGEIHDEYDSEQFEPNPVAQGGLEVAARMSLDDLEEIFGVDLDYDDVETVGGLLAKGLGRVPILGSTTQISGFSLTASRNEGRRRQVSHVIVRPLPEPEKETE